MDVTQLPLVRLLDMPVQNLAWPYAVGMVVLLVTIWWAVSGPSTVDGVPFSRFVLCASALVLGSAFLLLAQAIEIWRRLRPGLLALSHSRIEPGLASVAKVVRWNLSLVSPHLSDLAPLASRADRLYLRLLVLAAAGAKVPRRPDPATSDRKPESHDYAKVLRGFLNRGPEGLFRDVDFDMAAAATTPLQLATLNDELEQREYAPLLQSQTWFHLWGISDQLVGLLEKVHWPRCEPTALSKTSESSRKRTRQRHNPDATPGAANSSHALVKGKDAWEPRALDIEARRRNLSKWLNDCETLIALQCGLVLRDILARLMSCLFTAMVCLTLLTAGHLFYLFQGRSSFLTVDLIAVTCASAIAVWLLVAMERDPVLSRLRHTTPGRVDVNWEFLKRVGLYGVLPLVAVLGSLFPEIQEPLLGWLDPLRKLVSF
jgi:hypothetical protein